MNKVRDPRRYKGLRTRFRSELKAPCEYKFRTYIRRRPEALVVLLKKGRSTKRFLDIIRDRFPILEFEGLPIKLLDRH